MKRTNQETDSSLNKRCKPLSPRSELVGLTEFVNHDFIPLTGEFKSRVEDFVVTEINLQGVEVRVESFSIPEVVEEERNPGVKVAELSEDVKIGLNKVLEKETPAFSFPAPTDKLERTALHKSIGKFNCSLSSETVKEGENSVINVKLKGKLSFGNRDKRPGRNNNFLHFTLLKWNVTTSDAVLRLSKLLNVKPKNFSYAGQKDKRGITSQRVSCRFLEPKRLAGINRRFFEATNEDDIFKFSYVMGDFEFNKSEIKLGDLSGNRFSVVLRDCEQTSVENLQCIRKLLLENGFLNYFGLQRFGNNGDTHEIGKLILKKDYQAVVEKILTPNEHTKRNVTDCLNQYKTSGDPSVALHMLSYKNSLEGLLLTSLSKDPTNFKGALKSLHYKQQTLYTHAYQSYVWNLVLSRRVREHGTAVLPGDLVWGEGDQVRHVSGEEAIQTDITQVLLPLPGYDVVLPDNCCREFFEEVLQGDGMSLEDFKGSLGKEFNVSGAYRNLVFKPTEFEFDVIKYNDENEKLISTDMDRILEKKFERLEKGDRTAVRLQFTLPKSCYATMLLREIRRHDGL